MSPPETALEVVVLDYRQPDGTSETWAFSSGARANQAAAGLVVELLDNLCPETNGERIVELIEAGDYAGAVRLYQEAHEGREGYVQIEFSIPELDVMPFDPLVQRDKALAWLHADE